MKPKEAVEQNVQGTVEKGNNACILFYGIEMICTILCLLMYEKSWSGKLS